MGVAGRRPERVAELVRETVAGWLQSDLRDPRVGFVTVTGVHLSADLRHARVAVTVMGDEDSRRASLAGLASAAGAVRRRLARTLRLKVVPEIIFELDRGAQNAARVGALLAQLRREEKDQS